MSIFLKLIFSGGRKDYMPINLSKGQRISLEKDSGAKLNKVVLGLGWDQKQNKGWFSSLLGGDEVDLDASCIMFNDQKEMVDSVWFRQLYSKGGSVRHSGDNRTGEGIGDDEQIFVNLSNLPKDIKYLIFTINSFTGDSFESISNAFCRLVDTNSGKEIARYNLTGGGNHTAQVMVKLYNHENEWKLQAIGEPAQATTFRDMVPTIKSLL